ncbi:hypothetical protein BDR04DRAFT_1115668 [Suillus decipiens]|nr:hypothetical protein BDR04DRAFT_1115668 [Suillus decipiens]
MAKKYGYSCQGISDASIVHQLLLFSPLQHYNCNKLFHQNDKDTCSLHNANGFPLSLPISKAAINQAFQHIIKNKSDSITKKSPRNTHFKKINPSFPSRCFAKLADTLPRCHAALLTQLRTGHVPSISIYTTSQELPPPHAHPAESNQNPFTTTPLACPTYESQRNIMRAELVPKAQQIKYLTNDEKSIKSLFEFIARTRRLINTFGDVTPRKREQQET